MRLWTLHPRFLDSTGLVALWREALLAREVLRGRTVGYRHHPQLQRFRSCAYPRAAINQYLAAVHAESVLRGYRFDPSKLGRCSRPQRIAVTDGQLCYEWNWLMQKLALRSPTLYRHHLAIAQPDAHPMFRLRPGPVAEWESVSRHFPRHAQ